MSRNGIELFLALLFCGIGLYLFGVFTGSGLWFAEHRPDFVDTGPYYNAGRMLIEGQGHEVYEIQAQRQHLHELFCRESSILPPDYFTRQDVEFLREHEIKEAFFLYPPNSLWLMYLSSLGKPIHQWLAFNILSFTALIIATITSSTLKDTNSTRLIWFLAGTVCLYPFWMNFKYGQLSLLIVLAFYGYYKLMKSGVHRPAAGFCLSLLLLKPQLGIPLLLIPLKYRDWCSLGWAMLFIILQMIFAYSLIGLNGFVDYLQMFHGLYVGDIGALVHSSFVDTFKGQLEHFLHDVTLLKLLSGLFALSMLILMIICPRNDARGLTVACLMLLGFLIPTYHTISDYCIWLPVCLLATEGEEAKWRKIAIYTFSFISISNLLLDIFLGRVNLVSNLHVQLPFLYLFIVAISLWIFLNNRQRAGHSSNTPNTGLTK